MLPVGFFPFHKNAFLNYQLNRWYSLGFADKLVIEEIGAKINNFEGYIQAFSDASEQAIIENNLKQASLYCRASEFLMSPGDPHKLETYDKFIELFDLGFVDEPYERHEVPYEGSYLSCIRIPSKTREVKGTIIGCGGFDSFIEEFYCIWDYFSDHGYDVIAFEGPGQGGTRRRHGLTFDHDWEKPTGAVLDFFEIEEATALGISMVGYWVIRAAAFEKRIKHVIAMPPLYDWLELTNSFNGALAKWMLKREKMMNFFIRLKMNIGTLRHTVNNALYIQGKHEPIDAVRWMMDMNKTHIHSHLVDQDVFLVAGENDAFQPLVLMRKQKKALVNANSISERVFTKAEHADQHCQMGNIGLLLKEMREWVDAQYSAR